MGPGVRVILFDAERVEQTPASVPRRANRERHRRNRRESKNILRLVHRFAAIFGGSAFAFARGSF
jgi:hypothetical protein